MNIQSIEVFNLEEDKGPFATLNDEVILIQGAKNSMNDSLMWWQYSDIFVLSDSIPKYEHPFHLNLAIDTNTRWLFLLIEMDTEQSATEISQSIRPIFSEYSSYPPTLLKEKIRLQMGDDDLLGFYYLTHAQVQRLNEEFKVKGMHMFNRFEYLIRYSLE